MTKLQQYTISLALVAPTAAMLLAYALMQPTLATMVVPLIYSAAYAIISLGHIMNMATETKDDTK